MEKTEETIHILQNHASYICRLPLVFIADCLAEILFRVEHLAHVGRYMTDDRCYGKRERIFVAVAERAVV